jgi:S-adenosylmethionine/arginine decarboxylase-like enzyme
MHEIKHLHILLRAECLSSPGANDEQKIYDKVVQLISDIGMKVFMNPVVKYMPDVGNEGLTYIAGLETSHTSFHAWEKPSDEFMTNPGKHLLQMDAYTCGDMDINQIKEIFKFISEYSPILLRATVINRATHDMKEVFNIEFDITKHGDFDSFVRDLATK